jgi:hypothetical protein
VHTVNIVPWSVNMFLVLYDYLRYLCILQLSGMHSISTKNKLKFLTKGGPLSLSICSRCANEIIKNVSLCNLRSNTRLGMCQKDMPVISKISTHIFKPNGKTARTKSRTTIKISYRCAVGSQKAKQ